MLPRNLEPARWNPILPALVLVVQEPNPDPERPRRPESSHLHAGHAIPRPLPVGPPLAQIDRLTVRRRQDNVTPALGVRCFLTHGCSLPRTSDMSRNCPCVGHPCHPHGDAVASPLARGGSIATNTTHRVCDRDQECPRDYSSTWIRPILARCTTV
jgi:hypothetical protein